MSISTKSRGRRRLLAAVVGAGLLAGTLGTPGALATGTAETDSNPPAPRSQTESSGPVQHFEDDLYVVVMAKPPTARYLLTNENDPANRSLDTDRARRYQSVLEDDHQRLANEVDAEILESYTSATNGFAAKLTGEQAGKLAARKDVLMVRPNQTRHLDTVHTPDFLKLQGGKGVWSQTAAHPKDVGKGIVIGVIDTGIAPKNPSVRGRALPKGTSTVVGQPARDGNTITMRKADGGTYRGVCETGDDFPANSCNDKLIGARSFPKGFVAKHPKSEWDPGEVTSPRDGHGHGTHTATTAAGNYSTATTLAGRPFGKASGMAPGAKISAYKVCFEALEEKGGGSCQDIDVLGAIDAAVSDNVDVINFSISGALDSSVDVIELAFMTAASTGIFVSASAGNSGPKVSTVAHNSPWVTTVAASTHTDYLGTVKLANGTLLRGASSNSTDIAATTTVLSTAVAKADVPPAEAALCQAGSLDPAKAAGKIVVCDRGVIARVDKSKTVKEAGGVGMVLANVVPGSLDADVHSVPTVHINETDTKTLKDFLAAAGAEAKVGLLAGDKTDRPKPSHPVLAAFSSRGPALANKGDLLKPDISAPGVSVFAGVVPHKYGGENYGFMSGTSMSAPHIAGLAALILGVHPQWSPMTVKSAMMTTGKDLVNADGTPDTDLFHAGSGHVDPTKFMNPGLVFDSGIDEWLSFIAGQGFDLGMTGVSPIAAADMNTPNLALSGLAGTRTVTRKVTALAPGVFRSEVNMPGFDVKVNPPVLSFAAAGESRTYTITLDRKAAALDEYAFGHLTWTGNNVKVRTAMAVRPVVLSAPGEVPAPARSGEFSYDVTGGINGSTKVNLVGLVEGSIDKGTLVAGASYEPNWQAESNASNRVVKVTVPAGTKYFRAELEGGENVVDADLYVIKSNLKDHLISKESGATRAKIEKIEQDDIAPGDYYVTVNMFETKGNKPGEYTLRVFMSDGSNAGNATVSPETLPLTVGQKSKVTVKYSNLKADKPYLGLISYSGSKDRTVVVLR